MQQDLHDRGPPNPLVRCDACPKRYSKQLAHQAEPRTAQERDYVDERHGGSATCDVRPRSKHADREVWEEVEQKVDDHKQGLKSRRGPNQRHPREDVRVDEVLEDEDCDGLCRDEPASHSIRTAKK